ncbi:MULTISPECIES: glycoside hydrolase family 26 protein [unclassified Streptomyces]|uniref:glycoside hydrolase family 26 protein n=1 Tax=unclassified Streptomyces TaxID=2593676 RepID=UPI0035D8D4B2
MPAVSIGDVLLLPRRRTALLAVLLTVLLVLVLPPGGPGSPREDKGSAVRPTLSGVFTGSDARGVARIAQVERWRGRGPLLVGRTYLPGDDWESIEGPTAFLAPWSRWRAGRKDRLLVLNVPMLDRSEARLPDSTVSMLLRRGERGRYDGHFRTLARHLVRARLADSVLVLGWEMNGVTYTHRCGPAPAAWRAYWRRIVKAMRSVPGQRFRFDFAPSRGRDAVAWTRCYPGDGYVDIIGMDTYDQPRRMSFRRQVEEPYGLRRQVTFARQHRKPVSYPEWGLFRNGDNPAYVQGMRKWFRDHPPVYESLTDYCPHGVWQCGRNRKAAREYRRR